MQRESEKASHYAKIEQIRGDAECMEERSHSWWCHDRDARESRGRSTDANMLSSARLHKRLRIRTISPAIRHSKRRYRELTSRLHCSLGQPRTDPISDPSEPGPRRSSGAAALLGPTTRPGTPS